MYFENTGIPEKVFFTYYDKSGLFIPECQSWGGLGRRCWVCLHCAKATASLSSLPVGTVPSSPLCMGDWGQRAMPLPVAQRHWEEL